MTTNNPQPPTPSNPGGSSGSGTPRGYGYGPFKLCEGGSLPWYSGYWPDSLPCPGDSHEAPRTEPATRPFEPTINLDPRAGSSSPIISPTSGEPIGVAIQDVAGASTPLDAFKAAWSAVTNPAKWKGIGLLLVAGVAVILGVIVWLQGSNTARAVEGKL